MRTGTAAASAEAAPLQPPSMADEAPRAARLPGPGSGVGPGPGPVAGADRRPGDVVLGRYALVRILGRGGAGTVWMAEDRTLGRVVAIKCLPGDGSDRALAEGRAAARLGHATVVGTYGVGTADGCAWLVTEFVHGDTLRRTIREDTHTDDELLQIGVALCVALRHAHSRGIVHRDVTPRNVLVPAGAFRSDAPKDDRAGDTVLCHPNIAPAKLADFGIARPKELRDESRDGRIVGTLSYMAPERLTGGVGDEAGDLWALGVILHEAFVGEHPAGKAEKASALVRLHAELPSLAPRRPDLPAEVVAAIDRAVAEEPAERGSVEDLERALRHGLRERGVAVAQVLREQPTREIVAVPPAGRSGRADHRPRGTGPVDRRRSEAALRRTPVRRPPLLRAAPVAAALGALLGPVALLGLVVAALAVALSAGGSSSARSEVRSRVAAGIVVLTAAGAAAGVVVAPLVGAVAGAGAGVLAPAVAFGAAIALGACLGRMRAPRSIR